MAGRHARAIDGVAARQRRHGCCLCPGSDSDALPCALASTSCIGGHERARPECDRRRARGGERLINNPA